VGISAGQRTSRNNSFGELVAILIGVPGSFILLAILTVAVFMQLKFGGFEIIRPQVAAQVDVDLFYIHF
jgi:uncharacterized membrane protein YeaQ/YmgE (transglycosylase-associated protein family)